tara:strand:+ start:346 stop:540 length:195 start_codon:yes stop_codon:yes gene_type:complete
MSKKHELSEEAKVAKGIGKLISDVNLNLDEVGKYLGQLRPMTNYNRMILVAEAAVDEVEKENGR